MTDFEVERLRSGLNNFDAKLSRIDEENIERRTLKRAANEMAEMVRQAVVDEDAIDSPASLNSEYDSGPGPSMSTLDAWDVERFGGEYTVRPDPRVRQRAIVLNYGYPGTITPNTADALKFNINGVPVFADEVDGPEYTGYWQAALRRFESSDRLGEIGVEELRREFNEEF